MEEAFVFGGDGDGEDVGEDGEGKVGRHGVGCEIVDGEAEEEEEEGVDEGVKMEIHEGGPALRSS